MSIDARLAELGITLPQAATPVAAYVSSVEAGGMLHISGQISLAPFCHIYGSIRGRII